LLHTGLKVHFWFLHMLPPFLFIRCARKSRFKLYDLWPIIYVSVFILVV
jgi:hypothetical protein